MIPIVFSTDHNYVMQTGVCVFSLLQSADDCKYKIFIIIDSSVTESDKEQLRRQVSIFPGHDIGFININNDFSGWYEIRGISKVAYYRLLIPWLLPDYDKVLYSDVDVIFRISLKQVYDLNMGDNYFGAVRGAFFRYSKEPALYAERLGIDPNNYFNSGFLLINTKKQREVDLKSKYQRFSSSKLTYQDQDIINLLCKGKIMPIRQKYCITPALYTQYMAKNPDIYDFYGSNAEVDNYLRGNDCILHYAGNKPWNTFVFAFADWWTTYRASLFYDTNYELSKYNEIMNPKTNLRNICRLIKRYILQRISK